MITPHPQWQWRWLHGRDAFDGTPCVANILPWFTRPCLDWLITQDLREKTVLEWGIGVDIPWWCANSKRFIGIEHDPATGKDHENCKPPKNSVLMYAGVDSAMEDDADTLNNYVRSGLAGMAQWEPHILVIDGIYRVGCAWAALGAIRSPRLSVNAGASKIQHVIVDNADYPGLQVIRKEFAAAGFKQTSYVQPGHATGWTTDVWEVPHG